MNARKFEQLLEYGKYLYLNTLFCVSRPKSNLTLEAGVAFLNSRFVSAAYERWTNRLFGDKFPKISKMDLARLPVPSFSKEDHSALHDCGERLCESWGNLKQTVQDFEDFLAARKQAGVLGGQFWEIERKEVLSKLPGKEMSSHDISQVVGTWEQTVSSMNDIWSVALSLEDRVDRIVSGAFGLDESLLSDLLTRAPATSLEDVLLPR